MKQLKLSIMPRKEKEKSHINPRLAFTTPYCSHRHKTRFEAEQCAQHTRMKMMKMRGGI